MTHNSLLKYNYTKLINTNKIIITSFLLKVIQLPHYQDITKTI